MKRLGVKWLGLRRERADRAQRSLFGRMLDWMLVPALLLWPLSVALTWLVAQGLANQPFDRELAAAVRLLGRDMAAQAQREIGLTDYAPSTAAAETLRTDDEDSRHFQVRGLRGEVLAGEAGLRTAPEEDRAVPGEVQFRDDVFAGQAVRVAAMAVPGLDQLAGAPPVVQVAETRERRARLAIEITKGVILPQLVMLPLAVLLVWLALTRGIAPLHELQQRLARRHTGDLSPIDEIRAPEEVAPLVRAINDLLGRLDESIRAQKHFLADAAHQLKTPLAGLRTQAELAEREIEAGHHDPEALRASLRQIASASQNAAHMVDQLLAMARVEHDDEHGHSGPVDIAVLARDTVRGFVPRALEKGIDLGFEGEAARPALRVVGNATLLRELMRNLVDNALLYTPRGGTVTVRVLPDPFGQVVVLQVEDSGPGIAEAEREKVFRPFYRALGSGVEGSGLGLAIVREIATRHSADVSVGPARERRLDPFRASLGIGAPGALFTVRFFARAGEAEATGQADAAGSAPAPLSSAPAAGSSRSTSGYRAPGRA